MRPAPKIADDKLLLQQFYKTVARRGAAPYLTQPMGGGRIEEFSYERALDEARRMASHLKSLGYEPGSQIAMISKNCAWFLITELAIWMAGYTSVALYPTLNAETVQYILEHSEAKLLFVGKLDTWAEMKPGVPDGLPMIRFPLSPDEDCPKWNDIIAESAPIDGPPTRAGSDLAIIVYTSGSTGRPKGVCHSFAGLSLAAHGLHEALNLRPDDRALSYLPLAHVMERWAYGCVPLVVGFHLFFAESLDTFVQDLQRARPTLFISVPRLWLKFQLGVFKKMPEKKLKRMLKIPILRGIVKKKILQNLGLDQVRFAASGSAPVPAELIQWYRDLGLQLLEGYGMSENMSYSHVSTPGRAKAGFVGHTYADVECRISDEGEIQVKSPANMMGYFKAPELTEAAFTEDGWLKTGDRGEVAPDGLLKITGRVKELFKTAKGKYVAPAPIENILNNDGHIELSCVAGSGQVKPHAVVQLSEDLLPTLDQPGVKDKITKALEALIGTVNSQVEVFEQIGFIVVAKDRWTIEAGFLTPTMKIRRPKLEDTYGPQQDGWYAENKKVIWEA